MTDAPTYHRRDDDIHGFSLYAKQGQVITGSFNVAINGLSGEEN